MRSSSSKRLSSGPNFSPAEDHPVYHIRCECEPDARDGRLHPPTLRLAPLPAPGQYRKAPRRSRCPCPLQSKAAEDHPIARHYQRRLAVDRSPTHPGLLRCPAQGFPYRDWLAFALLFFKCLDANWGKNGLFRTRTKKQGEEVQACCSSSIKSASSSCCFEDGSFSPFAVR